MKQQKDYFSYLIGLGGLFLTLISLFNKEPERITLLIWGAAALVVAVVMMYTDKYINKIEDIEKQVTELKNEYGFSKQINNLKMEIETLKKNKKAKNTDIEDLIKIGFLLIIGYLILKALGIIS